MSDPVQILDLAVHVQFDWVTRELTASRELNALLLQVEKNTTVIESALVLIRGLRALLEEALRTGDLESLSSTTVFLVAGSPALARAIETNTE